MNSEHFSAGAPPAAGTRAVIIRLDDRSWRAVEDGRDIGRAEASRRPDGRVFLSVDTWHGAVFDRLAATMLADLPGPLHTVVDQSDHDLTTRWERAGLTIRRREREYLAGTDPSTTGLDAATAPPGVTVLGLGAAREPELGAVYRAVRAEVEARAGWDTMPVEMPPRPAGAPLVPARYAVAEAAGGYVGLVRVTARRRHARIGLIAVREDRQRRGIARALLAAVLEGLHRGGVTTVSAEVDERNHAARALFEGIGARHVGGAVELGRAV